MLFRSGTVQDAVNQANVLVQALPYMQRYSGRTFVVKYGGAAMVDERLKAQVMQDIVLLRTVGIKPVLVHGGGKEVSEVMQRMGLQPRFAGGLRVTDAQTMEIVEMVLAGTTNKGIVSLIHRAGGKAVGLSGKDGNLLVARKLTPGGNDIGYVGEVTQVNAEVIEVLAAAGRTVERRDVRTGRPLTEGLNLSEADVTLRLAGTRLYALGARSVLASPLGFKGWFWPQFAEEDVTYLPEAAMVTRDYLLLPYASSRGARGAVRVRAFSRAIVRSGEARSESGLLSYEFDLGEPIRIRGWRAADGGVYYLTFDGRLNWLKGSGGMQQAAG